jgi:peptidoglycan biosynthesis protein MviN/MurJ (putative lipid II flippase)
MLRIGYNIRGFVITVVLEVICCIVILLIKRSQKDSSKTNTKDLDYASTAKLKLISYLSSITISTVNALLGMVMRRIAASERMKTTTHLQVSVAVKLTLARFINSSALLVLVNHRAEEWFNAGNLVNDATILLALLIVYNPVYYLFDMWRHIRDFRVRRAEMNSENYKWT